MTVVPFKDTKIRPATPEKIALAAAMLGQGGVVAIPTDTVYGLAADALDKYAVARIFDIKGRRPSKPLVIFMFDLLTAKKIAHLDDLAVKIANKYWPGPLTLVVPRYPDCPLPNVVTAGFKTLGLRIPGNPVALKLLQETHGPIVVTSANRSGGKDPVTAKEVCGQLRDKVDLILDDGPCDIGTVSTVLDISGKTPKILREGAISRKELQDFLGIPVKIAGK